MWINVFFMNWLSYRIRWLSIADEVALSERNTQPHNFIIAYASKKLNINFLLSYASKKFFYTLYALHF